MYPPVEPDELTRHATEINRVLLDAGITPAGVTPRWAPLVFFSFIRLSLRTKTRCYQHFRRLGLLVQDIGYEGLLCCHLLHTAWLLAFGYIYQDPDGLYWVAPRQSYDYHLNYELAEATLAELIGLGELEDLVHLMCRATLGAAIPGLFSETKVTLYKYLRHRKVVTHAHRKLAAGNYYV